MNITQILKPRIAAAVLASAALASVAACSGSSDDSHSAANKPAATAEAGDPTAEPADVTSGDETTPPNDEPTTPAEEPPPNVEDGVLSPQEMEMIYSAHGVIQDATPDFMLQVSGCGSATAFSKVKPEASKIGVYQTDAKDAYWVYIGYYPGNADQAFAATDPGRGCDKYLVTDKGTGLDSYRVTPAKSAPRIKAAPAHTRLSGFDDVEGGHYQQAYFQRGDYVIELFYYTSQGFSDLAMKSYAGYALSRFNRFVANA